MTERKNEAKKRHPQWKVMGKKKPEPSPPMMNVKVLWRRWLGLLGGWGKRRWGARALSRRGISKDDDKSPEQRLNLSGS